MASWIARSHSPGYVPAASDPAAASRAISMYAVPGSTTTSNTRCSPMNAGDAGESRLWNTRPWIAGDSSL